MPYNSSHFADYSLSLIKSGNCVLVERAAAAELDVQLYIWLGGSHLAISPSMLYFLSTAAGITIFAEVGCAMTTFLSVSPDRGRYNTHAAEL